LAVKSNDDAKLICAHKLTLSYTQGRPKRYKTIKYCQRNAPLSASKGLHALDINKNSGYWFKLSYGCTMVALADNYHTDLLIL